ncbi:MAG: LysR substrate-binding domain-containing protein [Rhizobiaceae bacterium]
MDTMGAFESYVCAISTGSLSGAARLRKMSQPAVSQQISALEVLYGTKLLHRERNGVRMTQSGEVLYKHAAIMLNEKEALQVALETLEGNVAGTLTVTATISVSQHLLGNVIIQLAEQHPDLKIVLRADDQVLNLASEGIDIAIRAGNIGGGAGIVRKIAALTMMQVATPAYLDTHGRPKKPEDLINLNNIQYGHDADQIATFLSSGDNTIQVPIKTGLTAQLPDLIFQALYGNLGYTKAPQFLVTDAIQNGQLEEVLPKWRTPEIDLFLVYPTRETFSPRIMAFLKVLFKTLESTQGVRVAASVEKIFQAKSSN